MRWPPQETLGDRVTLIHHHEPKNLTELVAGRLYYLQLVRHEGTAFQRHKPHACKRYLDFRKLIASKLANEVAAQAVTPTHVVSPPTRLREFSGFFRDHFKARFTSLVDLSADVTRAVTAKPVSTGHCSVQEVRDSLVLGPSLQAEIKKAACVLIVDDVIRSGSTVKALLMALEDSGLPTATPVIAVVPLSLRAVPS